MNPKYELGQKVVVVKNEEMYEWPKFDDLIGKECVITEIFEADSEPIYILDENKYSTNFIEECLVPAKIDSWRNELQ